ncbi:hypothetical protein L7F22_052478 [Adiantum nelumboides]|nr:hypothetical protein [Adiantum nelumboides]
MGKKMHMLYIFPNELFPNVQFKPRRSAHDKHLFQVECKVAGAVLVNPELRDKRLLIGAKFTSLTEACLASNFTIRLMVEIRNEVNARLRESARRGEVLREVKESENTLIPVPHVSNATMDPLEWYKKAFSSNAGAIDIFVRNVVRNILDKETFSLASAEIATHARRYALTIIEKAEEKQENPYVDPPLWRNKINDYLAKAPYNVHDPMGKPPRKVLEEVQVSYSFAPRVIAVNGGPNLMSLVYHLHIHGHELGSPCFFNKNLTLFSKSVKFVDNRKAQIHSKWQKSFSFSDEMKALPSLHISIFRDQNYYGGTFTVDYLKDEGLKVIPWANIQPTQHAYDPTDYDVIKSDNFDHDVAFDVIKSDNFDHETYQKFYQPCSSRNKGDENIMNESEEDDYDIDQYARDLELDMEKLNEKDLIKYFGNNDSEREGTTLQDVEMKGDATCLGDDGIVENDNDSGCNNSSTDSDNDTDADGNRNDANSSDGDATDDSESMA